MGTIELKAEKCERGVKTLVKGESCKGCPDRNDCQIPESFTKFMHELGLE